MSTCMLLRAGVHHDADTPSIPATRNERCNGAAFGGALPKLALADDDYPNRPVRLVVGYAAGGVSDILARLIGQKLSERLGQPFVIDNRPGAGGNVGADAVVHAPPDGYTLLLAGMANAINVSLYPDLDFNFARDMAPVAVFSKSPMVLEVNPSFPAQTVPGLHRLCQGASGRRSIWARPAPAARPMSPASCFR